MQGEEQQVLRRELAWPFEDPQRAREAGTEWAGGSMVGDNVREQTGRLALWSLMSNSNTQASNWAPNEVRIQSAEL